MSREQAFKMRLPDAAALLGSIPLFSSLSEPALRDLEAEITWVNLPGGATLFSQGDVGDALYIVIRGRLRVFDDSDGGIAIGEVGRGESVGEMAILSGAPRSATVRAVRDSALVKLSRESFENFITRYPQMMQQITVLVIKRMQGMIELTQVNDSVDSTPVVTIAVVPASGAVPLSDFTARLLSACSLRGPTLHLTSARLDEHLGQGAARTPEDDPGNSRIVAWLNEQEEKYDFLIYEAEAAASLWTSRCFRQADCLLMVAWGRSEPASCADEIELIQRHLSQTGARKELVLLYREKERMPAGTIKWLKAFGVERHHQVHLGTPDDFARVSRFLTGHAVGLVLSGGGARALAHIGVIRALKDEGVPIDLIGGASLGAGIAAQYAMGWDTETMIEIAKKRLLHSGQLQDYVFPLVSLISTRGFIKILEETFGDTQIEDLWIKYFCVTTNLTKAQLIVHQEGLLRRWLRAGAAVPGIAPPEVHRSDLLVDGGVLNNLPVDVMRKLTRGPVIAVDVGAGVDLTMQFGKREHRRSVISRFKKHKIYLPSAWKMLWNRLNPFAEKIALPYIHDILLHTASLSSVISEAAWKEHTSLYIKPPVSQFKLLDWHAIDEMVEIGYEAGRRQIEQWRSSNSL